MVQSITVGILWATVITVQSSNSVRMVFCKIKSVALSIDAVASSSTNIRLLLKSARPKQNNCLCPMLQLDPSSITALQALDHLIMTITKTGYIPCNLVLKNSPKESSPCSFSWTASWSWHFPRTLKTYKKKFSFISMGAKSKIVLQFNSKNM